MYNEKTQQAKITHTVFVEYQDTTRTAPEKCVSDSEYKKYLEEPESVNDLVILPIEFELRFDMSVKDNGPGMFSTPEFKLKKSNIKFEECNFAFNYLELGMPAKAKGEEDFDDDEEDEQDFASITSLDDLVKQVMGGKRGKRSM